MGDPNSRLDPVSKYFFTGQFWYMSLVPAFSRQRQADLCGIEANLVYRASFRTLVLRNKKENLAAKSADLTLIPRTQFMDKEDSLLQSCLLTSIYAL